jgi:S-methylmethionine-dependent homocysteine/selenocysteine methylase
MCCCCKNVQEACRDNQENNELMNFKECIKNQKSILMEGALGERLKREFNLVLDENVFIACLIYSEEGRNALYKLWSEYAEIASRYNLPFLATTPTRRVNKERIEKSNYDSSMVKSNVDFLRKVQRQQTAEMYVGGLLGCRGDAYTGEGALEMKEAQIFHTWEVKLFSEANVDFMYAALMPTLGEAAGMALAIEKYEVPYIISFTIKKDGCLIDGTPISDAITYIDNITKSSPICYMTNCVHPKIVYEALMQPFNRNEIVNTRFIGIQANTSPLSFSELDHSNDLKSSEPIEFAEAVLKLREINQFKIFGGCCGTDGRHIKEIARRI